MDILEQKSINDYNDLIMKLTTKLKFGDNKILFKGSSAYKTQYFFSDYDLYSLITKKYTAEEAYNNMKKILDYIVSDNKNNLYFMELKIQQKDGTKFKWFPNDKFDRKTFVKYFSDVDFIKLDIIIYYEYRFTELSVNYQFNETLSGEEDYIASLEKNIKELKDDDLYYKILKRLFGIYKAQNKKEQLIILTKFFNSDYGNMYQVSSNLDAINKILKEYDDKPTHDKININLKYIKHPNITNFEETVEKNMNIINKKAKVIYNSLNKNI